MSLHSRSARNTSAVLTAAAGLAAAALVAGCGSSGSAPVAATGATTPASSAPADDSGDSASASAPGSAGDGTVVGGTALQTKLKGVAVPSGFKVDSSSVEASGATPTSPGDYIGLKGCSDLTNSDAQTLTSDHGASYAEYDIDNTDDLSVTVVLSDYYSGDADKQMSEVSDLIAKCATYQATDTDGKSVSIKVTSKQVSGLGDQALDVHLGASVSGYVADEFLLVRTGDQIVAMNQDDASGSTLADLSTLIKPYVAALG